MKNSKMNLGNYCILCTDKKNLQNNSIKVHCNLVNSSYQQASKVLLTFVPNKQFGQLISISPHLLTMLKTTNADFQPI